jgi:hypothetical protein
MKKDKNEKGIQILFNIAVLINKHYKLMKL